MSQEQTQTARFKTNGQLTTTLWCCPVATDRYYAQTPKRAPRARLTTACPADPAGSTGAAWPAITFPGRPRVNGVTRPEQPVEEPPGNRERVTDRTAPRKPARDRLRRNPRQRRGSSHVNPAATAGQLWKPVQPASWDWKASPSRLYQSGAVVGELYRPNIITGHSPLLSVQF